MIVPVTPFTKTQTICFFSVVVKELILSKKCTLFVNLYDANKKWVSSETFCLEGEDYTKWGEDDTYITSYVSAKLLGN